MVAGSSKYQSNHKFGAQCHTSHSSWSFTLIVGENSARVQQSSRNITLKGVNAKEVGYVVEKEFGDRLQASGVQIPHC